VRIPFVLVLVLFAHPPLSAQDDKTCTYTAFSWHADSARTRAHPRVVRSYSSLADSEIHAATGCSICEEDQVEVSVPPLATFRMCRMLAGPVREALEKLIEAGEPVFEVVGYRVGKTRGRLDSLGYRTGYSSHAYGIAIDVNPDQNGFYHNCIEFGPGCKLMQGGAWLPGRPGTLTAGSPIVRELKEAGLLWGGEIAGRQKDFMHFSPTGY